MTSHSVEVLQTLPSSQNKNDNFFGNGTSALVGFHFGADLSNLDSAGGTKAQQGRYTQIVLEPMVFIH